MNRRFSIKLPFVAFVVLALGSASARAELGDKVLWSRLGEARVSTYDELGIEVGRRTFYKSGYQATSYANDGRILWTNSSGHALLSRYDSSGNVIAEKSYGPYSGWTATSYERIELNQARLLWTTTSGLASLWTVDANDNFVSTRYYYNPGWSATSYASWNYKDYLHGVPWSREARILWTHPDGRAQLWSLDGNDNYFATKTHGPYAGWEATSFEVYNLQSRDPGSHLERGDTRLLWTRVTTSTGWLYQQKSQASVWTVDANDSWVSNRIYSISTGLTLYGYAWKAQSLQPYDYCNGPCPTPDF